MNRFVLIALAMAATVMGLALGGGASAGAVVVQLGGHSSIAAPATRPGSVVTHRRMRHARQAAAVRRALQGSTQFQCTPAAPMTTPVNNDMEQTCVIAGPNGTCIEKSDSPVVVQTCNFTQTGPGDNHATAVQVVAVENGGVPADSLVTQHATQIVNAMQNATLTASNFLDVTQDIKQSLGPGHFDDTEETELDPDTSTHQGALALSQESHQIVSADQTAEAGSNNSSISQSLRQRQRAVHAMAINESQNTMTVPSTSPDACPIEDDPNANMCARVHQTSGAGPNSSTLNQVYNQFERAHDTPMGNQTQGISPASGGMNHEIEQTSTSIPPAVCTIKTNQDEDQTERAVRANVNQIQNGPIRKGADSFQHCGTSSTWTGSQNSSQLATSRPTETDVGTSVFGDPATQNDLLEYFGVTTGHIEATQSVSEKVNNQSTTANNSCSGMTCAAFIACGQALADGEGGGACVTTCPEGETLDAPSGKCSGFSDLAFDRATSPLR